MAVEMGRLDNVKLTPGQEIKLIKPATELYVGQILKTVVIASLSQDQVLININGQHLNARTPHHFSPGELLEVKVIANQEETVLQVQKPLAPSSVLQNALVEYLPKQAPPNNLLQALAQIANNNNLPGPVNQSIHAILANVTTLSQLPTQLVQAIQQSGVFLESHLLETQKMQSPRYLRGDLKGLYFKLLSQLQVDGHETKQSINPDHLESRFINNEPLPLPGAIPQPIQNQSIISLLELSSEKIQHILREETSHVLARVNANQINHLKQDQQDAYVMMLDIPLQTEDRIDVIPLMIKQHKAEPMQISKWSISFAVNLPTLGKMQATVSIYAKDIDVKINAESPATMHIMNQFNDELKQVLLEAGLYLRNWSLQVGLEENHIDTSNLHLLDIKI
ncbi:flagellar hook-length control protein FliK [Legionella waltersii]|uniref:Flagellar hook-length control protein FliK n=1 Tax=Legionella waltersii TaxID=66969 RepID=A0A0W1A0Q9_9GAMM|nr:flagellar hook-length control protein FliK [Legionella waltersii]KTD74923.1 Flagellar hook-length control protein FliK [Legionella waltersii]SNV12304.1 Flagellar hook-length control protein FliK [Legionella waltersii]